MGPFVDWVKTLPSSWDLFPKQVFLKFTKFEDMPATLISETEYPLVSQQLNESTKIKKKIVIGKAFCHTGLNHGQTTWTLVNNSVS